MTEQQPPPPVPPGFGPPPPQYAPSAPDAPEFLAVDKHSSVVVDASGVAFDMYDIVVDFTWPEIRSVHYKASPDGRTLMVAVVHIDGRVYECVVTAKPRELLRTWFAQLAWVLGYYRPVG
ncbi:hypothetical protein NFX46_05210 [Streptomyces phaeoluteigriseus]|uniref:Uncharacterized protein n=1 Tax=Streptomyces phaeoluteigriseus TaxID=114686 RepID=A0ABY4Z4F3_9ACTN|nr:hypothetical protein [Streptomyces phaeoluteigriseus]USQ83232.1 hypothetical protein NFX46_05210 [Streptomyces phaeoluteigriseus]